MRNDYAQGSTAFDHTILAGIPITTASRAQLARSMVADCLAARAGRLSPRLVFDANGHALSLRETDAAYRVAFDQADLIHADGGFLVAASRCMGGAPIAERSATTDMFYDCAAVAERVGLSFYLLGATEVVNAGCADRLACLYPGLQIVGRRNGYFTLEDEAAVIEEVNASGADLLWVGLGKPKEQQFAVRHRNNLRAGWIVTCGGCFNYVTGAYPRAPRWMQNFGIEWIHRMATNPRKLTWRYLTTNPHALWLLWAHRQRCVT